MRTATADDWPAITDLLAGAFADDFPEEERDRDRIVFEPERTLVMLDGDQFVGNAAAYTRDLTVPGEAAVAAGHVTLIGVRPTYRRRRILTRLVEQQLRDIRAAGEPLAVLWASEGRIYQRYGYGMASTKLLLSMDRREVRLLQPPAAAGEGRLRDAALADVRKELAQVYERMRLHRPGWSTRDERWWEYLTTEPASVRRGATEAQALLYEGPDGCEGYAVWRTKANWTNTGPAGEAQVRELVAASVPAYLALWQFLLTVDLTRTVRYWCAATDEPLLHLVNEPRHLGGLYGDGLWVRLVDLPAALTARRYAAPVDVVFEVADGLLPENAGRWRLRGSAEGATCTRTDDPADLVCGIAELSAAYLGGTSLAQLADGGRVRAATPGSLRSASTAFGWHRAPSALEIF
jgi:predicted acetyltransferase